jgi:hypothetical protein
VVGYRRLNFRVCAVHWNWTKTFAILAAAQVAIRIPLTYAFDPHPFDGPFFAAGVDILIVMPVIGVIADLTGWARRALGNRAGSARRWQ